MPNSPREPYRIPAVLRDLQLVDLLELTGSTTASAAQSGLSQSSVSRRYRALAADLGLHRLDRNPIGMRYGHTPWMQLLRQGINSHRLAWGVLRIGGAEAAAMGLQGQGGVEWITLGRRQLQHWQPLLQLELLDAVALPQPPLQDTVVAMPYRLLPYANGWLACRPEPQVLRLAACLCEG
ncbi:MAG: LysR family transcriptional regulator [Cyanobacteria bacterium K_DeepCast_35m_m2_023]|nr:LysR family transcriptional regulator [Cyanobacteria bacterium K_DeepCast_35m_m2_023]